MGVSRGLIGETFRLITVTWSLIAYGEQLPTDAWDGLWQKEYILHII
jgi:hypothetical protein